MGFLGYCTQVVKPGAAPAHSPLLTEILKAKDWECFRKKLRELDQDKQSSKRGFDALSEPIESFVVGSSSSKKDSTNAD